MTVIAAIGFSCEDDPKPVDPVYEFVAFKGPTSVNVNEFVNSETPFPLVIELKAFSPYPEDITVTLEVTGHNADLNSDFLIDPGQAVIIPSGSFVSDTILVRTIDNASGSTAQRSFDIAIVSVSKPDVRIGLGIAEPKNAAITVNILDDECSETMSIFNSAALTNTINWGGEDVYKPAAGVIAGNTVEVTGDLIDYGAFSNATLVITLAPASEGATKGTATFGEQVAGTDSDGYEYKFIQTGEGTYDVCSGVIDVAYDIYYLDGGDWVYWYSVTNRYSVD